MRKKYRNFISIFFVLIFATSFIYASGFILANTLENGTDGFYFTKNFMLEKTKGKPRIIFESGSNSQHGINSLMIEHEFGKLTLNMGLNGGYPLDFRLHRLAKHLSKDDIVILPLEYGYYAREDKSIFDDVLNELGTHGKYYFNALPLDKKLETILQMSFKQVSSPFKNALNFIKFKLFNTEFKFDMKADINELIASGERGDVNYTALLNAGIDLAKMDDNNGLTCDEYLSMFGLELSRKFKASLDLVKQIQSQSGAKIIFTYPAVAGKNCYDESTELGKKLVAFVADAKSYIENNGFLFIGDINQSYFPNDMLNTYWHINERARDIRTQNLIKELKKIL